MTNEIQEIIEPLASRLQIMYDKNNPDYEQIVAECMRLVNDLKETFKQNTDSEILRQEYIITNPLNNELAITGINKQLQEKVFKDLINGEKEGIRLVFTLETIET